MTEKDATWLEDNLSRKRTALQIAALLPTDINAAESILGMVQDLLIWRGGQTANADDNQEVE